jgi:hypothetical protein
MDINGSSEIGNHIILMGNSKGATVTQHKERPGMHSFFYTITVGKNCYGATRHFT